MTVANEGSGRRKPRGDRPAAAAAPEVSPGRRRFVAIWTRAWGLAGAVIVVYIAARLPGHLQAGDSAVILRDVGLALISFNLIMQAIRPGWPMTFALPLTLGGMAIWLYGWLG